MKKIKLKYSGETIVDNEDYEYLNVYKWRNGAKGYAVRMTEIEGKSKMLLMHRVILERQGVDLTGLETDHINRKPLDNRRSNLRAITHTENLWNTGNYSNSTTGIKGVGWQTDIQRWTARIRRKGRLHSLGTYATKEEAAEAYLKGKELYHKIGTIK